MNILVIGNGFDLAHELPTSYSDFLEFCRMIREIYSCKKNENIDDVWDKLGINLKKDINTKRLKEKFIELYHERFEELMDGKSCIKTKPVYDEIYVDIDINFWIDYFLNTMMNKRENWIDFESEISNVIQELDDDMMGRNKEKLEGLERSLSNEYVNDYFSEYISMKKKLYMYAYGK